ncbi:MAG: tRNA preQ1(34) S-adenosylmethionine ribosyltransferase-isomerase QueA [Myxococcota bacterium]|nr:tRNA preQ1(34) S-adenosylmethionine ribosyltransferase-isomerase QueA [Myxococcota bacterium]
MELELFQYDLPDTSIARFPADARDAARLMHIDRASGRLEHQQSVAYLKELVRPGDVWVINDTKVRPARLHTRKATGGRVELLVTQATGDEAVAMYRASKPPKAGTTLYCANGSEIQIASNRGDGHLELVLPTDVDSLLHLEGEVPLPPYLQREAEDLDKERYQTVYAREPGAVAAPTAGLHVTSTLMQQMEDLGATFAQVTLHVGPGTFRPIRTEHIEDHTLHSETYEVTSSAAEVINQARRVVAVGTTSVRTLESVADDSRRVYPGRGETNLYIRPGYRFKRVDAMLTNFHLPGSSLLVLISAFAGIVPIMRAYRQAVETGYRFYSYGDAMFIETVEPHSS